MPFTTTYKRGDVVLVPFPFTDLSSSTFPPLFPSQSVFICVHLWFSFAQSKIAFTFLFIPATLASLIEET